MVSIQKRYEMEVENQVLFNGSDWSWTETAGGYSAADGWSLKIALKYRDAATVVLTGAGSGSSFLFSKPASETRTLSAGEYGYQAILTKGAEVLVYGSGTVTVQELLQYAGDSRDYWRRIVDKLRESYERLVSRDVSSVSYGGRTFNYVNRKDLLNEMVLAERKAGMRARVKRLVESY